MTDTDAINVFVRNLESTGATVIPCTPDTLSQTVIGLIAQQRWGRVVSVRRNRVGHPSVLGDDPPLTDDQLASVDAVITESAGGVADVGAVVMDHSPGQGRPGLTVLPPVHVCVVESGRVVSSMEDLPPNNSVTVIGGPNNQAEGVHRASALIVVLVSG